LNVGNLNCFDCFENQKDILFQSALGIATFSEFLIISFILKALLK